MPDLLLSEDTSRQLRRFIDNPSHALIILGQTGSGKATIANHVASQIVGITDNKLESYAYFRHIRPVNNSIGIEIIRDIKLFIRLKTTGNRTIRRAVVIEDAHLMTIEAQNALLKVLEEPPSDTVLLLTASTLLTLKPTIPSRAQRLQISSPSIEQTVSHFKNMGFNQANIMRSYALSGGQIGLLSALLEEDSSHSLVASIEQAKSLLSATRFERMTLIDSIAKEKEKLPELIGSFKRIAIAALEQATMANKTEAVKRWHASLRTIYECEARLQYNPNPKLLLMNLLLHL